MKLTVEKHHLASALDYVARVVERRNTIPILSNLLLSAAPGKLEVRATDLDLEVSSEVTAEVDEPGHVTVNADTFEKLVKKLPDGCLISLDEKAGAEKDGLTLKAGRSRVKLLTLDAMDFPSLAAGEFQCSMTVPAHMLAGLFDRVGFAVSTEETRYYLCGIYLHLFKIGGSLVIRGVATDGHRLALHQFTAPEGADGMPGVIVPRKAVGEIGKILKGRGKQDVLLEVSPTKLRLSAGATVLTTKLIDGTFPDYERVIPSGNNLVAVLERESVAAAADRVATVASERGRGIKLTFSEDRLCISAKNPDTGDASEEIDAQFDGAIDIGVNSKYLAETLRMVDGEKVRLAMADPGSPMLFQADGGTGDSLLVLMPMRV